MQHRKSGDTKVLIASLVGSSVEWYDYFLYGTVASLVFNRLFFPTFDPVSGLLLAYASFAIPFFIRPLGGAILAHIGDKFGRKNTLVLTLALMGSATVLIGLLPDYSVIGVWAPILLFVLRLVQGFGIGGEWGGALLLAVEYAPKERRGFYGSIPQMGITIGMLLGTLSMSLVTLLPEDQFLSWGWRIPFLGSILLVVLGLWIRKGIEETPVFQQLRQKGNVSRLPLGETLRDHWRSVLIAIGVKVVETAPFYIFTTFIISYATVHLGFSRPSALNAVTIGTLVTTLLIPLSGRLSDRFGRKRLYIIGTAGIILFAFPYFVLLQARSFFSITAATVIGVGILWAPITAVIGTLYSEIFDAHIRYTGVTLGYQLGAALAGGTAPLVATALMKAFDESYTPVACYIMMTGIISLIAIMFVRPK